MVKIGIIDNNYFMLRNLKEALDTMPGISVGFAFPSIADLESAIKKDRFSAPDIILLDTELEGISGIEGIKILKGYFPEVKIVMFSVLENEKMVIQSIREGACGYIIKTGRFFDVYEHLLEVHRHHAYLSPVAARILIDYLNSNVQDKLSKKLSGRELELVMWLKDGLSYKEIAEKMNVTVYTVNHHLKNIYKKLGVASKSELIALVLKNEFH